MGNRRDNIKNEMAYFKKVIKNMEIKKFFSEFVAGGQ